ncbi:cellulase family glycosylhydrolase [Paenibacillus harenae]|uniref:Aryl-phospho-beta-D-glucosidase BglC (GH1 family) n=1 Tax=Paenibacillus harenae TaxID=306543 RepID=A0ABT9U5G3_PAEHA|nr:cellulase family glycosylhydrolase [Paenibacillus harenae]MDQ0114477.1 aryl-phospho-beta-D-glucosidase BglC (GH1 family) [Paenibacillus harenae]
MSGITQRKYIGILMIMVLVIGFFDIRVRIHAEPIKGNLQQYVEDMQPGWNLGNTFDASGGETSWGNPYVTEEFIQELVKQGYRSIRIPITWNHRLGSGPEYIIQELFADRIREVVDWSLDAGLYVMINLHHDSHWMLDMENDREAAMEKYKAVWRQIAHLFKDYPSKLMFESINEPRFSEDWNKDEPVYFEMLDELNVAFHQIVRNSGGFNATRPLVLPTVTASPSEARMRELYKTIERLDDPNLIATIHYYGYYPFSVNLGVTTFDDASREDIVRAFDGAYEIFVARGVPVIIGEFGLLGFDKDVEVVQHGEILKYLEYFTYYAREKRMTHMLWDNGQHFDRRSYSWSNPAFYEVMMASLNGRSSHADSDSIYLLPGEESKDVLVNLNLNGNTLTGIRVEDRQLEAGADYEISGDQLTLKADFLRGYVPNTTGESVTLTCTFSAGADWKLHVIRYDHPVVRSIEGTRSMFVIPVNYNGDKLATMEAVYEAGGNAGPASWTPFQEYAHSFEPDYNLNILKLTNEFFNEVNDGEVLLKLHFRSGVVLDYRLSVSGSKVIGTSPSNKADAQEQTEGADDPAQTKGTSVSDGEPALQDKTNRLIYYWAAGIALLFIAGGIFYHIGMFKFFKAIKRKENHSDWR